MLRLVASSALAILLLTSTVQAGQDGAAIQARQRAAVEAYKAAVERAIGTPNAKAQIERAANQRNSSLSRATAPSGREAAQQAAQDAREQSRQRHEEALRASDPFR